MKRSCGIWDGGRGKGLRLKRLGLALVVGAGIVLPLAHQTTASADILCKSDPVIVVNGAIVDVVSTLSADSSAVREVDYQVTVPSGSLIGKITLTAGLGVPENVSFVFSPDQPRGTIQVAATAVPQDGAASFPVSVKLSSLLAGSSTASGNSGDIITVALDHVVML